METVYTAHVPVRHHELDCFGRVHGSAYLRTLAHVAVEASTAAGYDAAWYLAAGTLWLVRRSSFTVTRPARADDVLEVRTWVEDVRRVRSHRRYDVTVGARPVLSARTDWVYVDAATGRPRRVPAEIEERFGVTAKAAAERDTLEAPPAPAAPARSVHRVRVSELDGLGHMNNAAYLDVLAQAMFDALEEVGWSLDACIGSGAVPVLTAADVEYFESARYGDRLEVATWFTPAGDGIDAHQTILREGGGRALVRATTGWRWMCGVSDQPAAPPSELLAALRPLIAA